MHVGGTNMYQVFGASPLDVGALVTALSLTAFGEIIQTVLPLVGVAVIVGFLFYVVRWAIGLFRGI